MEKSRPPGHHFCPPLIGALKRASHSNSPHCSWRPLHLPKGAQASHLASHIVGKPPWLAPKEHVWGLSMVAAICFPANHPRQLHIYEGRWAQAWRVSLYSHAREPSTLSAGKVLPHTIRSSLAFAVVVPTSFLAEGFQQPYPNYPLQRLIPPWLGLTSAPISGVLVGLPSSLPLQSSCSFEDIPPLLVSSNRLDSVLPPWPIGNSSVVSRRMTWRESTSWPLPKKTTQVGGRFPPRMTLHHSGKCSFTYFVCTGELGWGPPACWDGETGCFWVFTLAGMLAGIQILDIKTDGWLGKKKSSPPSQHQDLLPNSASILLCGSGEVLRAGCVMGTRETRGHAGYPWASAPEKPWHGCFSVPSAFRKALASRGLSSSLTTRK